MAENQGGAFGIIWTHPNGKTIINIGNPSGYPTREAAEDYGREYLYRNGGTADAYQQSGASWPITGAGDDYQTYSRRTADEPAQQFPPMTTADRLAERAMDIIDKAVADGILPG